MGEYRGCCFSLLSKGNVIKNRERNTNFPTYNNEGDAPIASDPSASVLSRISCWIVLEALSPQTYKTPESLANDDVRKIAWLDAPLPWETNTGSEPKDEVFYEIILGSVNMDKATEQLIQTFGSDEERARPANEEAVLASIFVNSKGEPLLEEISVSSFGWALPLCLNKRFSELSSWIDIEKHHVKAIKERLNRSLASEVSQSVVDVEAIRDVYHSLVDDFELSDDLVIEPSFMIKRATAQASLLNSFFLEDLVKAERDFKRRKLSNGLKHYLRGEQPQQIADLLTNDDALEQVIAPSKLPESRWSMGRDRALVLLQQASVNIIQEELRGSGIAAVNGPPGTGKTTLLRDVISQVIVNRATAMCRLSDPARAFKDTGEKIQSGGAGFWKIFELHESLKGHEIIVASSNNAAVENISRELPELDAIADPSFGYFRTISDSLAGKQDKENNQNATWGLIAAVLGNSKNRREFVNSFWRDPDCSMRVYLKAAKGDNVEKRDKTQPVVVEQESPPDSRESAKNAWEQTKREFLSLKKEIEQDIAKLEQVRSACLSVSEEKKLQGRIKAKLISVGDRLERAASPIHPYSQKWPSVKHNLKDIDRLMTDKSVRPAWYKRFFRLREGKLWTEMLNCYRDYRSNNFAIKDLSEEIQQTRAGIDCRLIDDEFFELSHSEKQITAPWESEALNDKRERLFLQALRVHKAFIDVNAQKLLHNLSLLMNTFSPGEPDKKVKESLSSLWSSLFLVVPVLSTSFASVHRMLGDLPNESIGWLLIDEAGQAVPQAAVGAMMRSRRTVVVGDPVQIPPVVTLPQKLINEICHYFTVDPDVWAGPKASVQTLADQVSAYQSTFGTDTTERKVGIPLLVHRRCEDPMFSICNIAAYDSCMVSQVKPSDGGEVRSVFGSSSWINVTGEAESKWCEAEGDEIISLLTNLRNAGVEKPDLFIITPFRQVAQSMRYLLNQNKALLESIGLDPEEFVKRNVGTVHTVQGREADTVFFLLGAPSGSHAGARQWAGSPVNLLNVAVSRAKKNLYIVGSRDAWAGTGSFTVADDLLD